MDNEFGITNMWHSTMKSLAKGKIYQLFALTVLLMALTAFAVPFYPLSAQESNQGKLAIKKTELESVKKALAEERRENKAEKDQLDKRLKPLENLYLPKHWTDPANGFAIGGFDPVAYYSEGKPLMGNSEFQGSWHGTSWQFLSDGNRRIFAASPNIYAPRYAGFDPYALSEGTLAEGQPVIWTIIAGELFFFQNPVNKHLWLEGINKLSKKTASNWQRLSIDLPSFKVLSGKP